MKTILAFFAGVGIGAAATYIYNKNKVETEIKEEIEALREAKINRKNKTINREDTNDTTDNLENEKDSDVNSFEIEKAKNIINYSGYSKKDEPEIGPCEAAAHRNPLYIIKPEEFASEVGYDTETYYIFKNNVITNDNNEVIDNVEETFGLTANEIRNQFGIYEQDAVYIRNEKIDMDFEILRELNNFEKGNGE